MWEGSHQSHVPILPIPGQVVWADKKADWGSHREQSSEQTSCFFSGLRSCPDFSPWLTVIWTCEPSKPLGFEQCFYHNSKQNIAIMISVKTVEWNQVSELESVFGKNAPVAFLISVTQYLTSSSLREGRTPLAFPIRASIYHGEESMVPGSSTVAGACNCGSLLLTSQWHWTLRQEKTQDWGIDLRAHLSEICFLWLGPRILLSP